jgi:predicted enzyme related to lactoylglutathione lyase
MPNAFAHIELSTDNLKKAEKFYQSVFSWKLRPMPKYNYTMIDVGKGGTGGGMQKKTMPEAPNAWLPYVKVDDVRKTVAKASKAGARVMLDYMDIGEMGAIGVFADPSGAAIGVWQEKTLAKKPAKTPAKKSGKKR